MIVIILQQIYSEKIVKGEYNYNTAILILS